VRPLQWEITWRPPELSASFHGRDLFAPIAARLARGEPPSAMAMPAAAPAATHQSATHQADWPDDLAEIVYIDRYGNALTGLRGDRMPASARLSVGGRVVAQAEVFSAVPRGTAFWYVNSNGLVEIAVNTGRADQMLGLGVGTAIELVA
jgi:S-adenosyl-L-methionine hydrolase (adenosine-forming)